MKYLIVSKPVYERVRVSEVLYKAEEDYIKLFIRTYAAHVSTMGP